MTHLLKYAWLIWAFQLSLNARGESEQPEGAAYGRLVDRLKRDGDFAAAADGLGQLATEGKLDARGSILHIRILREIGEYKEAARWAEAWLDANKDKADIILRDKVTREKDANVRLAAGWRPPVGRVYGATLDAARMWKEFLPPAEALIRVADLIEKWPDEWEGYALKAEVLAKAGKLDSAEEQLALALEKGGEEAQEGTTRFTTALREKSVAHPMVDKVENLINSLGKRKTALHLQAEWRKARANIPVGITACKVFTGNRDFEDAAGLASEIVSYLKANPESQFAAQVPVIVKLRESALRLDEVRDSLVAEKRRRSSATRSRKPARKSSSPGGGMSSEFLKKAR